LLPPRAVAQGTIPPANQQTELFRGLLHFHKIEPETYDSVRRPEYDFSKLIVVIVGQEPDVRIRQVCLNTLSGGGAVLFATDLGFPVGRYLPSGRAVTFTPGPTVTFNGVAGERTTRGVIVPTQAGVLDRVGGQALGGVRPEMSLFAPFNRIEVNGCGYMTIPRNPPELARTVAMYPRTAVVNTSLGLQQADPTHVFAAAGAGPKDNPFRCVAMADSDVISNRLIYGSAPPQGEPNDNLKFANALVQWLKEPTGRDKCLFIENTIEQTKFDDVKFAAIPTGPMPPMPPVPVFDPFNEQFQQNITEGLNKAAADAQENNRFNNMLADTNERKAAVYRTLAILAAIVLFLLLCFRSLRGRFKALFQPIPKDPHRLGVGTEIGSFEHRRLELLRGGNYGPPVRAYIRQLFEDRGLPAGFAADAAGWPPKFVFDLKKKDYLKRAVTTLWAELAATKPINYTRWKELEPLLTAARAAADDGRWWIETADPAEPHRGAR
jgi:hypothetical protein